MNKYILVFALLSTITSLTANAAMIDDFNGGDMEVIATNAATEPYSSAFGGKRTINIEKTGPRLAYSDVMLGEYSHNTASGTSAISTITWSSAFGVDLIEGRTSSSFAIEVLTIDQGNIVLTLFISDIIGNTNTVSLENTGVGTEFINFNLFTGIDFLQVNEISLEIAGGISSDLTIGSISTVPTPSILILLGMGIVAFSFNRRITIK